MEHIHNCGNCAHFEACDSILKRYAGLSGIAKDGPACGNYAVRIEDILGDDYDLDRLRELVEADRDGRCVVLPAGGHTEKDGENALKSAMNTCFYHNNPVTRYIADAVAEKLTREAADAALKGEQHG